MTRNRVEASQEIKCHQGSLEASFSSYNLFEKRSTDIGRQLCPDSKAPPPRYPPRHAKKFKLQITRIILNIEAEIPANLSRARPLTVVDSNCASHESICGGFIWVYEGRSIIYLPE
jgi:hypothetical protein